MNSSSSNMNEYRCATDSIMVSLSGQRKRKLKKKLLSYQLHSSTLIMHWFIIVLIDKWMRHSLRWKILRRMILYIFIKCLFDKIQSVFIVKMMELTRRYEGLTSFAKVLLLMRVINAKKYFTWMWLDKYCVHLVVEQKKKQWISSMESIPSCHLKKKWRYQRCFFGMRMENNQQTSRVYRLSHSLSFSLDGIHKFIILLCMHIVWWFFNLVFYFSSSSRYRNEKSLFFLSFLE